MVHVRFVARVNRYAIQILHKVAFCISANSKEHSTFRGLKKHRNELYLNPRVPNANPSART